MHNEIDRYWQEIGDLMRSISSSALTEVAALLYDCWRGGGTIFVLGNGGSAATASHLACDLAKGTRTEGLPPFRVVPLADCTPLLTAWANDAGYERVFAEQVGALVRSGDTLILLSVSGNSPNILAAVEVAQAAGALVVALTGKLGGRLRLMADLSIQVPGNSIEQVEDIHLMMAHSLCVALRAHLHAEARVGHKQCEAAA